MGDDTETNVSHRDDIFAMFSASGYHRARVTSLSDFNRIAGGIAWALIRYGDVSVPANLWNQESEDKNIKLRTEQSEAIIRELKKIECPHELSAHQLLGLDFANLKNVIQWLLRHVLALDANEHTYEFFVDWFTTEHDDNELAIDEYRYKLRQPNNNRLVPNRYMKRFDNNMLFDLGLDAKCTLAEYVTYSRSGKRMYPRRDTYAEDSEVTSGLQISSSKKNVPTCTVREMMENAVVDLFKEEAPGTIEVCGGICKMIDNFNIPERLTILENRLADEARSYKKTINEHDELQERFNNVVARMKDTDESDIQEMAELVKAYNSVHARAAVMRECSVHDFHNARELEESLRNNRKDGVLQSYNPYEREIMEQHAEKTKELAGVVRNVLALQFRLDRIMGVGLSSQYRKRNLERIVDSDSINQEMKASVIDYNITIDILTFSAKITGFMNQVEKSLMAEPASQEYRDAFMAYMNDVRTQLGEYHWKAKLTQDNTITEKQTLAALRNAIRVKEREVTNTSKELKKLLNLNKNLQEAADLLDTFESNSTTFKQMNQQ